MDFLIYDFFLPEFEFNTAKIQVSWIIAGLGLRFVRPEQPQLCLDKFLHLKSVASKYPPWKFEYDVILDGGLTIDATL